MNNKVCDWFGHAPESLGRDSTSDFPSENFKCKRCGLSYSVNQWSGAQPRPKIVAYGFYLLLLLGALWFISVLE